METESADEFVPPDPFEPQPEALLHERLWAAAPLGPEGPNLLLEATLVTVWGSAARVARWLVSHPEAVRGRRVVELGAGAGLPSLVAGTIGAASVVCTDYDEPGVAAASRAVEHNCSALGRLAGRLSQVSCVRLDWRDAARPGATLAFEPAEVIIAADCNYYTAALEPLLATIQAYLRPGGTLLLASKEGRASLDACIDALLSNGCEVVETVVFPPEEGEAAEPAHKLWRFVREHM